MALADGLPMESASKSAMRDGLSQAELAALPAPDGWGAWTQTDHLLAVVSDRLGWLIYATYAAQGGKPKEPEPMSRPGVGMPPWERRQIEDATRALSMARITYMREHMGAVPPDDWTPDLD